MTAKMGLPRTSLLYLSGYDTTGVRDGSSVLQTALNVGYGAYVVRGGTTLAIASTITRVPNTSLFLEPGATIKWIGAASGTMFADPTNAGPMLYSFIGGLGGYGIIDAGGVNGFNFLAHHSPKSNVIENLVLQNAGDQTGTWITVAADVANTGGLNNNKNADANTWRNILFGRNGTFMSLIGQAPSTQCITLNEFDNLMGVNQGVGFLVVGPNADSNNFMGICRASINQNNAIGLSIANDAATYNNKWETLTVDTFAGKTGRIGINIGAASSRNVVEKYFNNPAAEGGQIVDNGCPSYLVNFGDWVPAGQATSSLVRSMRGVNPVWRLVAVTYTANMTPDGYAIGESGEFLIVATNGTAFTINLPTNLGKGVEFGITVSNTSGGALGAITFAGAWKMPAFTAPTNGNRNTAWFFFDGTNARFRYQTGIVAN